MPIGALSRISKSLSQGGKCVSNLRGILQSGVAAGEPFDYIKPARRFSVDGSLSSISTEGAGDWSNTIKKAFYSTDPEGSAAFRYADFPITTGTSGTLVFRMYIQTQDPTLVPQVQTIFQNGDTNTNGYRIVLTHYEVSFETYEYDVHFARCQDPSGSWVKLNSSSLSEASWNQFSVRFTTNLDTVVTSYQNGSETQAGVTITAVDAPGGNEAPFWLGFYGRLTDMAVLNGTLTNAQLAAYGTAPYI